MLQTTRLSRRETGDDPGRIGPECAQSTCSQFTRWTGRGRPPKYCPAHAHGRAGERTQLIDRLIEQSAPNDFSRELRRAIDRSGKSLASISKELAAIDVAISPASLSAWQRG